MRKRNVAWYEEDFYAWTHEQAEALRRAARDRVDLTPPLDYENLADEIESLGNRDRREICGRLGVLLAHLLKLSHSRVQAPRRVWRRTVLEQRDGLRLVLDDSPSLQRRMPEFLAKAWPGARRIAIDVLDEMDGIDATDVPQECPWTTEQVLDPDFWPVPSETA